MFLPTVGGEQAHRWSLTNDCPHRQQTGNQHSPGTSHGNREIHRPNQPPPGRHLLPALPVRHHARAADLALLKVVNPVTEDLIDRQPRPHTRKEQEQASLGANKRRQQSRRSSKFSKRRQTFIKKSFRLFKDCDARVFIYVQKNGQTWVFSSHPDDITFPPVGTSLGSAQVSHSLIFIGVETLTRALPRPDPATELSQPNWQSAGSGFLLRRVLKLAGIFAS
ncbi:hypothetical protein QBC44DRAFT_304063 [Cladorrhinum sp. PSN332]|nr:hypothetical protein QBC44DRAFT_304063 [Cladorrhinum sp. PSN332]